jgi:valyl-tRNA synthetase
MSQLLPKQYDASEVEPKWLAEWLEKGYFHADASEAKAPYSITLPPPNVTGSLHMGHALGGTLQDILIRWRRMQGHNAMWMPGTDHAGIATQMLVERELGKEGLSRHDIGREAFLERVWAWKEAHGGRIHEQEKRMGFSLDWERERFTMDPGASAAVREVFVRLHEEGLIYRAHRLVNWCTDCFTAVSDLEVNNVEESGKLWQLRYPVAGTDRHIVVATTRPETMLGDTGVAVHPDDDRYRDLVGKRVELPLTGRQIPVVADEFVDPEFGSGAVKVTPGHDFNDFEAGQRCGLEALSVIDRHGRIIDPAPEKYRGMTVVEARVAVVADLDAAGRAAAATGPIPSSSRCSPINGGSAPDRWPRPPSPRSRTGAPRSSPSCGARPTCTGCPTSRTGASRGSCGGGTGSRRGTATAATTSPSPRASPRRAPGAAAPAFTRTRTCSTPGSPRRCGRSRPWAGRRRASICAPSIPPRSWSPGPTSSSSGSRG